MAALVTAVLKRGKRKVAVVAALALLLTFPLIPSGAAQGDQTLPSPVQQQTAAENLLAQLDAIDGVVDLADITLDPALGPPPWTSFVPGRDRATIDAWMELAARLNDPNDMPPLEQLRVGVPVEQDVEVPGESGLNDTIETGQFVEGFGTGDGESDFGRIAGSLGLPPPPPPPPLDCPSVEEDSTIDTANATPVAPDFAIALCGGDIGDGEFGDTSGDVDFYNLNEVAAGSLLTVDAGSFDPAAVFSVTTALYAADGTLLGSLNDSDSGADSVLTVVAPADGTYYAAVAGVDSLPSDPTDPSSGPGATYIGSYLILTGVLPPPPPPCLAVEPDSTLADANPILSPPGVVAPCFGIIGDGEFGDSSGDFDFFALEAEAGSDLIMDIITDGGAPRTPLTVALYDATGALLATLDDDGGSPAESFLAINVADAGTYYGLVTGQGVLPADPTDASSGPGAGPETPYQVVALVLGGPVAPPGDPVPTPTTIPLPEPTPTPAPPGPPGLAENSDADIRAAMTTGYNAWSDLVAEAVGVPFAEVDPPAEPEPADEPDVDVYLVDLDVGDAFGIGLEMTGSVAIVAPDGRLGQSSRGSATFIYPLSNPLKHLGSVGADFVAETSGIHAIVLGDGEGFYEGELRVKRAGLTDAPGDDVQTIFLDFDGGSFQDGVFDLRAPENSGETRTLSPLRDWLSRWGLDASDEDAVIDSVVANVAENLLHDLHAVGGNGNRDATGNGGELDVQILNSRDHADPWGEPNVSRVIIGGSIAESGIPTVGIAQSIDPGNFDTTETAIVLLDLLSEPAGSGAPTLNDYGVAIPFTKVDLVGQGVGIITAHEIGHYIGNWHTASFNGLASVMDEGGDLDTTVGVGPDRVLGTADDVDVDFVTDEYSFFEGFGGFENTTVRSAQALSTGQTDTPIVSSALCAGKEVTINMQDGDAGIGTSGDDVILGTPGDDVIDGGDGNDTICALAGDDEILGGSGRDYVYAGPGDDDVRAGRGNDRVWGQEGQDYIVGNSGADTLSGGSDDDTIVGSDGNDVITGYFGNDRLFGGDGNDVIDGGLGRDRIVGGAGNDNLSGNGGNDVLAGNDGDDALNGGSGTDTCRGDAGVDTLVRCE